MKKNEKIPQGYKMTEVGVIPEDWGIGVLGKISDVRDGTHDSPKYVKSGVMFITSKNIIDRKLDFSSVSYISKSDAIEIDKRSGVDKDDILMSMIGTIGNAVLIDFEPNFSIKNVALIKNIKSKVINHYLIQLISSLSYQKYIERGLEGGIQKFISLGTLRELQIPFPPSIKEQKAIATVLSDMDELIEKLEKLIDKKRAVKQGTMQQLLTGKKRLPGFSGEWEEKKLGEILKYEQPTKYIVDNVDYRQNAKTPVLTAGKTFILGYTEENIGIYNNLPVIIFDDFTTANKFVNFLFKVKSSAMKLLTARDANCYDLKFLYERMQVIKFLISDGDHKRRWIGEYQNIEILIPSYNEQKAIAQVLSDMDKEIEKLEKKKKKYQQIKEGAMQVLLTGKIRLI